MNNEDYVGVIDDSVNDVVLEKQADYDEAIAETNAERQEEIVQIESAEQNINTIEEGITQTGANITETEDSIGKSLEEALENKNAIDSAIEICYENMGDADDESCYWGYFFKKQHEKEFYDEKGKFIFGDGNAFGSFRVGDSEEFLDFIIPAPLPSHIRDLENTEIELTAICDKAKEDYAILKNAIEEYGKDYDEEAYNKATEGITVPVINVAETNQAIEALITKLEEYDDTEDWISALKEYQKSVEEINALNMEAMFNELYVTKDKYDELKSLKSELEAKKEVFAQQKAELDQKYEELKVNDAKRAEQLAQIQTELDKAMQVQEDVINGIYEKVDDPTYAKYNEAIDAYNKFLSKKDEEQKPVEIQKEKQVIITPKSEKTETIKEVSVEKPVYKEVQHVDNVSVPTATSTGIVGYALNAMVASVAIVAMLKNKKYW